MRVYEAILWYMNVYETEGIKLRQYDGIWKYMLVFESKW